MAEISKTKSNIVFGLGFKKYFSCFCYTILASVTPSFGEPGTRFQIVQSVLYSFQFEPLQADVRTVPVDSVHVLGFIDFNAPSARQASKIELLTKGVALINSCGSMGNNACMILLPDHPKDSSARGLLDEEKKIMENLFGLQMDVETRFVDLFTREVRSENRTSMRRFASGRIVVCEGSKSDNVWLDSELAICGRPVGKQEGTNGAPTSVLPRSSALLLPEAASPDQDLKLADRTRPSPEQTSAQKGTARLELLLEAAIRHTKINSPIMVCNLTGYVEEMAAAASWSRFAANFKHFVCCRT